MNRSVKNTGIKAIAVLLIITVIATLLPTRMVIWAEDGVVPQAVMPTYDPNGLSPNSAEQGTSPDEIIDALFEDTSLRTSNSKTLRLNDGTYTLGTYGFNIHFQTSDGFVEYDNTLIRKGDSYTPALSDIELAFDFYHPSYSIGFDGVSVRFELINEDLQPAEAQISELPKQEYDTKAAELFAVPNAKSQLVYSNISDGVSLSYLIYGRNIKENIILETLPEDTSFRFAVTTDSELYIDEDGCIHIGDATIPHAYMYDALGDVSDDVEYTLEKTGYGYILTVTPDREWLENAEREYPVIIDPTIITDSPTHGDVSDAYIREGLPNFNSNYYYLMHVGNASLDSELHKMRSFFRVNILPEIPKASRILSAIVSLQQADNGYWYSFSSNSSSYLTVVAKEVTSAWAEETLTWNNQPSFSDTVIDYSVSASDTAGIYLNFDITSCMQRWYEDSSTNYGIVLQSATESLDGFTTFISTDDVMYSTTNPSFYITYYDTKGLESRWAFVAEDVGTAGTVYVNLYNGKSVLIGPGLSTQDEILPLSAYPVYNGYLSGLQFTPSTTDKNAPITVNFNATVGYGFKLSCWESVTYKSISGEDYYCYNDSDGTELYFRDYGVLGFLSEDGYDLTLTINSNSSSSRYVISDSSGNEKHFNSAGRIKYIKDEYGNEKSFVYDSNNRLTDIAFKSKTMTAAETQLIFGYETVYDSQVNKYFTVLSQITNAKDSSIWMKFKYANSGNGSVSTTGYKYLRIIEYSNGDYAEYQYDSAGKMSFVKQGNGSTSGTYMELLYSNGSITGLRQYSSSNSAGVECSFQYDHKKATVRTAGKDDIFGNSDDLLSVYLFDNYGNTVCSYLTDLTGNTVYGASSAEYTELNVSSNPKANNSVAKAGGKGQFNKNLISNGNLESTTSWSVNTSAVSCSTNSSEFMFGAGSVCLTGNSFVCSGTLSQNVTISEPGTYTLSAYVKSNLSMGFSTTINGAYIALDGNRSDVISDVTNTGVQNGWRKLSVTKTIASAGTYTVEIALKNMFNSVYFDGVCLVKGDAPASEFNYLNGTWSAEYGMPVLQSDGSTKLSCNPGGSASAYAEISFNKPAASTAFMLSGWSKGYSVPEEDGTDYPSTMLYVYPDRFWGITAVISYSDNTKETQQVHFNPAVSGEWQYASGVIMPSEANINKTISKVTVYIRYDHNANFAYFKDICLTETDATAYRYDSNGNVSGVRNTESSSSLTYSGTDLTSITDSLGNSTTYTYVTGKHKILTASDAQGITATYGYNSNGLATSAVITPFSGSGQVSSSAVYDNYGNMLSETDSLGHTAYYGYNTNRGLLNYIDDANNNRTQYLYDLSGKLTELFADSDKDGVYDSGEAGITYTYNAKNYLTDICNGATTYHFAYDSNGNVTSVSIGSITTPMVSYSYASYNGKLLSTTYADGTVISNTYDELNRVKSVSYNGIVAYTVTYDGDGNVYSYTDCSTGRVYRYEYDALGREVRFFVTLNGTELFAAEKSYDSNGMSVGYTYTVGGIGSRTSSYTYNQYNQLSQETTAGGDTVSYTYDGFGRLSSKTGGGLSEYYFYTSSGSNTSGLVSSVTYLNGAMPVKGISYTYDALGNILTEDDGVTHREYTYDELNQLKSEFYYDKSTLTGEYKYYYYGKSGNINYYTFTYSNGNYSSGPSSGHTYGDSDWKELMTKYNGVTITYDANGNPLSYYNGQSYTFSWQKGRQLASAVTGTNIISYTYDANGLRVGKTVNGTAHTYTYDGSLLLCDKWGSQYIEYFYDASGRPYALNYYNGSTSTKYFFVKNIEGDILELRSSTNALVARYIYDGWGKLLEVRDSSGNAITSSTHIANLNALRYRGYFYDTETKLYYLQSRYYDPQTQRFISPDVYVSTGQGITGYHMFAYCNNNPIILKDIQGLLPIRSNNLNSADTSYDPRHLDYYNYVDPIEHFFNSTTNKISGFFKNGLFFGSGSLIGGYSESSREFSVESESSSGFWGTIEKKTLGFVEGLIGIGNNSKSLALKGEADVLTASARAGLQYQDGAGLFAESKVAVASGSAGIELKMYGVTIEVGITGDLISAGANVKAGIFPNEGFQVKADAGAGLFGGGFFLKIKTTS